MKNNFLLVFTAFIIGGFLCLGQSGKVVKIKDGDTIVILDDNNNQITLRLAEVDCPESKQAFGNSAKQFTANEVALKTVNYTVTSTDRYGRSIAKVYYDNKYLSEEIIKNGYGWHYKKYSNSNKLSNLEINARSKKLGIWGDKNIIAPWEFRAYKKRQYQ